MATLIVLSGCLISQDPLEVMKLAQEKLYNSDYKIEYNTKISFTTNDDTSSQSFRILEMKNKDNKKLQVFARDIVLLQESFETFNKMTFCTYYTYEDIECLEIEKPKDEINLNKEEMIKKLIKEKLIIIKSSKSSFSIGNTKYSCDLVEYELNFDKITTENMNEILKSIDSIGSVKTLSPNSDNSTNNTFSGRLMNLYGNICFDEITVVPLESSVIMTSLNENNPLSYETIQKANIFEINPLILKKDFEIPEIAKIFKFSNNED